MKKTAILAIILVLCAASARASWFLTLGYDYAFTGPNALLSSAGSRTAYLNGEAGYLFDFGLSASFKYDHITMEDYKYGGENARVVAVIPAAGLGYAVKFLDDKMLWWTGVYAGYAVSVRYRPGIVDHKANCFSPSFSTALYYNLKGQFYAGVETGYRVLIVNYPDIAGNPGLDLSGLFAGISIRHVFGE